MPPLLVANRFALQSGQKPYGLSSQIAWDLCLERVMQFVVKFHRASDWIGKQILLNSGGGSSHTYV